MIRQRGPRSFLIFDIYYTRIIARLLLDTLDALGLDNDCGRKRGMSRGIGTKE